MSKPDAWSDLEEAIERFFEAMGEPGLLMDWLVITHKLEAHDDGSNARTTSYIGAEDQPAYRALGLLEHAKTVIKIEIEESMRGI